MKIHLFDLCWCYDSNSFCVSLLLPCRFQKCIVFRGVIKNDGSNLTSLTKNGQKWPKLALFLTIFARSKNEEKIHYFLVSCKIQYF